ncbi:MAG: hypothetical protein CBC48_20220 [bacterium TMED88]|nr:MAG: hypothetical protein CBC48_20220 [bacterium TMED88]
MRGVVSAKTRWRGWLLYSLAWLTAWVVGSSVSALVLDASDDTGNTTPPDPAWGWSNVGTRPGGTSSVVYLGNRWVATAAHIGAGITEFGGIRYEPVAGSPVQLKNPDGTKADLILFQLRTDPELPTLELAQHPPRIGQEVTLVAQGSARGHPITVDSEEGLIDGFMWAEGGTRRWGTNQVTGTLGPVRHGEGYTQAFAMTFEAIDRPASTAYEAAAALGDSGGAVFGHADVLQPERGLALVGIIFSVSNRPDAPHRSSLYGSATFAADLAFYRDQILQVTHLDCPPNTRRSGLNDGLCPPDQTPLSTTSSRLYLAVFVLLLGLVAGLSFLIRRRSSP